MTVKRKQMALLLAGALGAAAFVYFIWGAKDREENPRPGNAAFRFFFRRQEVKELALRRDGQNVVIESRNGKWVISQPVDAPADQSVVNLLLNELEEALSARKLSVLSRKAGAHGLDSPAVTIELRLRNGEQHSVRFGDPDSSKQQVYTLMDDSPEVALLPIQVAVSADQSLMELRDRSLFDIREDKIKLLRLRNENGQMTLAREENGWKLKSPLEGVADRVAVESLLSLVRSARVTEFVSESAAAARVRGNGKHQVTLTVQTFFDGEKTLTLGAKEGGGSLAVASDRTQAGKVDASLYDKLNLKPSALYDRNIIRFDPDELKRIIIRNQNQTLAAVNQEGKWVAKTPSEYKGKELDLMGTLNSLKVERADEVLQNPSGLVASKLASPAITVQFINKNGSTTTLLFSAPDDGKVYLRRTSSSFVYKTERHIFNRLNFKVRELVVAN